MANDGKIYITISDTRNGSGGGVSPDAENKEKKSDLLSDFIKHKFFNFIQSEAKQIASYTIGNIGNFNGNYQVQRDVTAAMNFLNSAINIGMAAGSAAVKYGAGGAIAVLAITTASEGIKFGMETYSDWIQNKRVNRDIYYARQRLGLDGLTNGSRSGTN